MKKIISLLLVLTMMFSLAIAASADTIDTSTWTSEAKVEAITLNKIYTVTGSTDNDLYPTETLSFSVAADDANPDGTEITVDDLEVAGNTDQTIKINLPSYSEVGVYKYTITENEGEAKGVGYTDDAIAVTVLVEYDYANSKLVSSIFLSTASSDENDDDGKVDTFTNTYDVGHLTVTKEVTGNLGAKDVYFEMTLTLTSDKPVESAITVSGGSNSSNPTTIAETDWTPGVQIVGGEAGGGTTTYVATKTIYLKDGETLTFKNIPDGVTYAVEEAAKHGVGDDGFDANSATDTDYTVTYENETGTIDVTSAAKVTNEKKTEVNTGISLESAPYILMLVVAVAGMAVVVGKKRSES